MLDQLIISLLCYFSGVSWDLKSFRFSVCKASEVDPFIRFLERRLWWYRHTQSCTNCRCVSFINMFHITMSSCPPTSSLMDTLRKNMVRTATPNYKNSPISHQNKTDHTGSFLDKAELKSGCCPDHMIQY